MGFRDDIEAIFLQEMPAKKTNCLFLCYHGRQLWDLTRKYQTNPEIIRLPKKSDLLILYHKSYEVKNNLKMDLMARFDDC